MLTSVKPLSARHQRLSVYEDPLLVILFMVNKWYCYLIGHHLIICTDQQSLKNLLEQKIFMPLQHTWLAKFVGFDYKIMYWAGKENVGVDAFSCFPEKNKF